MPGIQHPRLGWLPSVTEVLGSVGLGTDYSNVDEATLARASRRGSAVHETIEAHHYGFLRGDVLPEVKPRLAAYERFLVDTGHEPIVSEVELISVRWRVCGHPDRIGWQRAERWLLDWKCMESVDLKSAVFQLAGYEELWNERHPQEPIHQCAVIQLKRDGTYRPHLLDTREARPVFQAAVVVVRAREMKG